MAVSWDPDWQTATGSGTTLSIPAATGESQQVALVMVGAAGVLSDHTGWTLIEESSLTSPGFPDVKMYSLKRSADSADGVFTFSPGAESCGLMATAPAEFSAGSEESLSNFGSPLIEGPFSTPSSYIMAAGWTIVATASTPGTITLDPDNGDHDQGPQVGTTDSNGVKMAVTAIFHEPPDPVGVDTTSYTVSDANSAAERRWINVYIGEATGRKWWLGVAGWS